jgi:hypothetical protein
MLDYRDYVIKSITRVWRKQHFTYYDNNPNRPIQYPRNTGKNKGINGVEYSIEFSNVSDALSFRPGPNAQSIERLLHDQYFVNPFNVYIFDDCNWFGSAKYDNYDFIIRNYNYSDSEYNYREGSRDLSFAPDALRGGEVIFDIEFGTNTISQVDRYRRLGVLNFKDQDSKSNGTVVIDDTAAHELGHILGLADRYSYYNQVNANIVVPQRRSMPMTEYITEEIFAYMSNFSIYKIQQNNGSFYIDNLMSGPTGSLNDVRLSDYQMNVIANHWIEIALPQSTFLFDSSTGQSPQSIIALGLNNVNGIDFKSAQPNTPSEGSAPLTNAPFGGFSPFGEPNPLQGNISNQRLLYGGSTQGNIIANIKNGTLQPDNDGVYSFIDTFANSGNANAAGLSAWNFEVIVNLVVDGVSCPIRTFPNRSTMIDNFR